MEIALIIFCYNEEGAVANTISSAKMFLERFADRFQIILVNDGSVDNTMKICSEFCFSDKRISLINHERNVGIGMALKSGYEFAEMEYVCAIPGDGQFDIYELSAIKPFTNKVFYSFYRTQTNYSFYRKSLTRFNRLFNQHALGIYLRDVNWIKVYRNEQLNAIKPELTSSLIESEICAKLYKSGITPIEIPSKYLNRKSGVSRGGSWFTLKKAIADIAKLWIVVIRFKPNIRF